VPRADFRFHFKKRVRYAEIDAQAVVYNARYLDYFDIGITEYFRASGLYERTAATGGVEFHVARAQVDYRAPMRLDEEILIFARCERIGRSSLNFRFELHGVNGEDLRASGETVQVHVIGPSQPAPVPDWIVDLFEAFEARPLREKAPA